MADFDIAVQREFLDEGGIGDARMILAEGKSQSRKSRPEGVSSKRETAKVMAGSPLVFLADTFDDFKRRRDGGIERQSFGFEFESAHKRLEILEAFFERAERNGGRVGVEIIESQSQNV